MSSLDSSDPLGEDLQTFSKTLKNDTKIGGSFIIPPLELEDELTQDKKKTSINIRTNPTFGYTGNIIRKIQRRGNTYHVRDQAHELGMFGDDPTDIMINDLYEDALKLSATANRKASIFKSIYILATFFVTIAGALIGVLSLESTDREKLKAPVIIAAALGFIITAVQTLMSTFSIEKRSVLLKDVSFKLREVSRKIKELGDSEISDNEKRKRLEEFYTRVNELDVSIFDHNISSTSVNKSTNFSRDSGSNNDVITYSSSYDSNDSEINGLETPKNDKKKKSKLTRLFSSSKMNVV